MLSASITCLPALSIGAMFGRALYLMDVPHRRIVQRNLSIVYPELSADQRRRLAGRVFQNYGVNLVEMSQMGFMRPEDVDLRSHDSVNEMISRRKHVENPSGSEEKRAVTPERCIEPMPALC